MPDSLVHESEEKLRAHFLHTGTPSATGLLLLVSAFSFIQTAHDTVHDDDNII